MGLLVACKGRRLSVDIGEAQSRRADRTGCIHTQWGSPECYASGRKTA